jgi:charged multivesicular body protein 5
MHRFLGKKKPEAPTPTLDDASKGIDSRGDEVDSKIKKLDAELADLKKKMNMSRSAAAKANFKKRALQVLKQRKMYEKQREHLYGQQMNIDQAKFATQSVKDNATMVTAMKATAKELKKAYKEVNINDIENLHDEMSDLMDMSEEVNQLMGSAYGVPEDVDEDELLDELDALDDDIELAESEDVPSYLQDVPKNKTRKTVEDEVDELGLPAQLKV